MSCLTVHNSHLTAVSGSTYIAVLTIFATCKTDYTHWLTKFNTVVVNKIMIDDDDDDNDDDDNDDDNVHDGDNYNHNGFNKLTCTYNCCGF